MEPTLIEIHEFSFDDRYAEEVAVGVATRAGFEVPWVARRSDPAVAWEVEVRTASDAAEVGIAVYDLVTGGDMLAFSGWVAGALDRKP